MRSMRRIWRPGGGRKRSFAHWVGMEALVRENGDFSRGLSADRLLNTYTIPMAEAGAPNRLAFAREGPWGSS